MATPPAASPGRRARSKHSEMTHPVRSRLYPALVAVTAVALMSCGRSRQNAGHVNSTGSPQRILVRGNGPGPDSLDPQRAASVEAQDILRDLCEGLTSLDQSARPVPAAAVDWSVSADGKTYTFHLRANARWSNGDHVVAADFVAGLKRLVDPQTASPYGQYIDVVHNARAILEGKEPVTQLGAIAPDESTVVIALDHPAPYLPALLSNTSTCPVHQPSLQQHGDRFARPGTLVSNGAFRLSEWISGQSVLVRRNPFYWANSQNRIDAVRWLQVSDASMEYLRYRSGEIDVTAEVPQPQIDAIRQRIPDELRVSQTLGVYYYGFNLSRPPFKDNAPLRRALMFALDREKLANTVLKLGEHPAYGLIPSGTNGYDPLPSGDSKSVTRLQQEAVRLLAESGYSAAHPLRFELWYNAGEIHQRLATAISAMWHETLGADITLRGVDFPTLLQEAESHRVDAFRSSWVADYDDPQSFLQIFASDSGMNLPGYKSAQYDALLAKAAAETSIAQRQSDLAEAERVLLHDAPVIPIYFYVSAHLVKPDVIGWQPNVMNVVYSKNLSFSAPGASRSK